MHKVSFNEPYMGKKIDPRKKEFLDKYIENELSNESPEVVEEVLEFIKYLKRFGYDYSEHYPTYVRTQLHSIIMFNKAMQKVKEE